MGSGKAQNWLTVRQGCSLEVKQALPLRRAAGQRGSLQARCCPFEGTGVLSLQARRGTLGCRMARRVACSTLLSFQMWP